ncbi:unnamed protein product, partial [Meganyctiphanes norvegica]
MTPVRKPRGRYSLRAAAKVAKMRMALQVQQTTSPKSDKDMNKTDIIETSATFAFAQTVQAAMTGTIPKGVFYMQGQHLPTTPPSRFSLQQFTPHQYSVTQNLSSGMPEYDIIHNSNVIATAFTQPRQAVPNSPIDINPNVVNHPLSATASDFYPVEYQPTYATLPLYNQQPTTGQIFEKMQVISEIDLPQYFTNNMDTIFSLCKPDLINFLKKKNDNTLNQIRSYLIYLAGMQFTDYANKRPINRRDKDLTCEDIHALGYSITINKPYDLEAVYRTEPS